MIKKTKIHTKKKKKLILEHERGIQLSVIESVKDHACFSPQQASIVNLLSSSILTAARYKLRKYD